MPHGGRERRRTRRTDGPPIIAQGREAVESGSVAWQIEMDTRFHSFLYELSGNPLIAETTKPHWDYLRRVMGEVLQQGAAYPAPSGTSTPVSWMPSVLVTAMRRKGWRASISAAHRISSSPG